MAVRVALARAATAPLVRVPKGLGTCADVVVSLRRELYPREVQRVPALTALPSGFEPRCLFILSQTFGFCCHLVRRAQKQKRETTLNGGSLGSCVDEERSQLRELM